MLQQRELFDMLGPGLLSDVTIAPGSIPGCVTAGHDWETHEAASNCPSVVQVMGGAGQPGFPCPLRSSDSLW